jgi:hypothetical protein
MNIIILIIFLFFLIYILKKKELFTTNNDTLKKISQIYQTYDFNRSDITAEEKIKINKNIEISGNIIMDLSSNLIIGNYKINLDNSGNLLIKNKTDDRKIWSSDICVRTDTINQKILLPALCDASGRYCIYPRKYTNFNTRDNNPYTDTSGHMQFIAYDTDKRGNGSGEWELVPKSIYIQQGFVDGFRTKIFPSPWNRTSFNDLYKSYHNEWRTSDGDTIPFLFRNNEFTTAQAWDSVHYGKQAYNFNKNPEHTSSNNPYQNQSNDINFRTDLT